MSRTTRRVLCGLLIAGSTLSGTAVAATPEEGSVSKSSPKVSWTGQTTGSYFTRIPVAVTEDDSAPCVQPSCDTFALTVADQANLTIGADIGQPADNSGLVTLRIHLPDGSVVVSSGEDVSAGKPHKVVIKQAKVGGYTVEYWNNFFDGPIDYNGFAELAVAGATPPPGDGGGTTPPQTGGGGPTPVQAIGLEVKVGKVSARKLKKTRKFPATVTVSREVTSINAIFKKGKKTVGKGKLGKTSGTKKLTVKTAKKLKKGTYALTVVATDGKTSTTKTVKVKVGR